MANPKAGHLGPIGAATDEDRGTVRMAERPKTATIANPAIPSAGLGVDSFDRAAWNSDFSVFEQVRNLQILELQQAYADLLEKLTAAGIVKP